MKIMLSEPTTGTIDHHAYDNRKDFIAESKRFCMESGHTMMTGNAGRYVIQNVREDMGEAALHHECDALFMIDDDMIVPHNTLERLLVRLGDADIVIPLAFQRVPPFFPVVYDIKEVPQDKQDAQGNPIVRIDFKKLIDIPDNGELWKVPAVGFGCVMLKTDILKKLPRPWFSSWTNIGEDVWFSWNASKAGFRVCVDTTFWVGHLADRPIIGRPQFEEFREHGRVTCWEMDADKLEEVLKQ